MQLFCQDYGKVISPKIKTKLVVKSRGGGGGGRGLAIALDHVLTQVILYINSEKRILSKVERKSFPVSRFQKKTIP